MWESVQGCDVGKVEELAWTGAAAATQVPSPTIQRRENPANPLCENDVDSVTFRLDFSRKFWPHFEVQLIWWREAPGWGRGTAGVRKCWPHFEVELIWWREAPGWGRGTAGVSLTLTSWSNTPGAVEIGCLAKHACGLSHHACGLSCHACGLSRHACGLLCLDCPVMPKPSCHACGLSHHT